VRSSEGSRSWRRTKTAIWAATGRRSRRRSRVDDELSATGKKTSWAGTGKRMTWTATGRNAEQDGERKAAAAAAEMGGAATTTWSSA
jgi:hypothetical protein